MPSSAVTGPRHGDAGGDVRRLLSTMLMVVVVIGLATPAPAAPGPAAKPARLLVPAGARVLDWSYSMPLPGRARDATMTITNRSVIARVRDLVNAIPVSSYPAHQVCPQDLMMPSVVRFSRSRPADAFTSIVFQLGGCPAATVYQHGVAQRPTLGGWTLPRLYAAIVRVISPRGQPLA